MLINDVWKGSLMVINPLEATLLMSRDIIVSMVDVDRKILSACADRVWQTVHVFRTNSIGKLFKMFLTGGTVRSFPFITKLPFLPWDATASRGSTRWSRTSLVNDIITYCLWWFVNRCWSLYLRQWHNNSSIRTGYIRPSLLRRVAPWWHQHWWYRIRHPLESLVYHRF